MRHQGSPQNIIKTQKEMENNMDKSRLEEKARILLKEFNDEYTFVNPLVLCPHCLKDSVVKNKHTDEYFCITCEYKWKN